jgi:hypothetical protein
MHQPYLDLDLRSDQHCTESATCYRRMWCDVIDCSELDNSSAAPDLASIHEAFLACSKHVHQGPEPSSKTISRKPTTRSVMNRTHSMRSEMRFDVAPKMLARAQEIGPLVCFAEFRPKAR